MGQLYLVPILHMGADMGSLAAPLEEAAEAEFGQELWQKHKETVSGFWDSIGRYFDVLDATGFNIYQDGMVADGEIGLKIVTEGISHGSKNYEIVGKLMQRGAVLVQTENPALVKQEYAFVAKMAHARTPREKEAWAHRYKTAQGRLLQQRDDFIAQRIRATLGEGGRGILFVGAYHNVLSKLPADVHVSQVKDVATIREYHKVLSGLKKPNPRFLELADYLVSPIPGSLSPEASS